MILPTFCTIYFELHKCLTAVQMNTNQSKINALLVTHVPFKSLSKSLYLHSATSKNVIKYFLGNNPLCSPVRFVYMCVCANESRLPLPVATIRHASPPQVYRNQIFTTFPQGQRRSWVVVLKRTMWHLVELVCPINLGEAAPAGRWTRTYREEEYKYQRSIYRCFMEIEEKKFT